MWRNIWSHFKCRSQCRPIGTICCLASSEYKRGSREAVQGGFGSMLPRGKTWNLYALWCNLGLFLNKFLLSLWTYFSSCILTHCCMPGWFDSTLIIIASCLLTLDLWFLGYLHYATVMILSFWTDKPGQTVQTQIRLLLEEQSDQGLHCLQFPLHLLDAVLLR